MFCDLCHNGVKCVYKGETGSGAMMMSTELLTHYNITITH